MSADLDAVLDAAAFQMRAQQFLHCEPLARENDAASFGCHVIAGFSAEAAQIETAHPAAVLVPIIARKDGLTLLLTERAAHLDRHAGQVALPGGRIDPGESAFDAALREAREEIGLDSGLVTPLGYLPPYYSGTGFRIQPLVALVAPEARLAADPGEVARIFEVPLALALDPERYREGSIHWRGKDRRFYIMDYEDAYIWGVTAGIIRSMAVRF